MTEGKYLWTHHAREKMRHYRLTDARIKRIIRHPTRIEEGVLENAVACMQPAEGKKYSEIWTMYLVSKPSIRIITAWRYPGKSPERVPVPANILKEARKLIYG
ncbi:MAG: hypothetical protein Q8R29_03115 [bacterium]|nr:hypothetical protein [bacterium]